MRHAAILAACVLAAAVLLTGCPKTEKMSTSATQDQAAKCPVCGKAMPEGEFCEKCTAVATSLGEFKCAKCEKTVKAGTYCAKHNKFRFPASAGKCPKCEKVRGTWCEKCGHYACLPSVGYDKQTKKPIKIAPKTK